MTKISNSVQRASTSHIPREVATNALLAPKISNKARKLFMRARELAVAVPKTAPADPGEKARRKMAQLTMPQLRRRLTQANNHLRRFRKLLDQTTLERFQTPLKQRIAWLTYCLGWLSQEINSRVYLQEETIDTTGN